MDTINDFLKTIFPMEHEFDGTLYYDETNNFRKFYLRDDGWNCDALNMFFVLGGLAIPKGQSVNTAELLNVLNLQKNVKEIKFHNLAGKATGFQDILNAKKIEVFWNWLNVKNIKIHYIALNYIYYALVDIVDAAMSQYSLYNHELDLSLKDALYEIVKQDIDYFINILFKYGYPKITDTNEFMKEFLPFIEEWQSTHEGCNDFITEYLRQVIKAASRQQNLDFFCDEEKYIVFKDFSSTYVSETLKFSKAEMIFDEEQSISKLKIFSDLGVKFVDSKSEVLVQLSDVVVGMISRYYSFLESEEDILTTLQEFTKTQNDVLKKFLNIVKQSSQYNALFDAYIGGKRALRNHFIICEYLGK